MKLKVYGCRGSLPYSRNGKSKYGGNTSCILLESGDNRLVLDAGSGLVTYEFELKANNRFPLDAPVDILLSHLHLDHIIGLPVFSPCWIKGKGVRIYTCDRQPNLPVSVGGLSEKIRSQVIGTCIPPYWPVSMPDYCNVKVSPITDLDQEYIIGAFKVTPFKAIHPDYTLSFSVTDGKKTVIHLLDNETRAMSGEEYQKMVNYCKNADLVVFDAAYSVEDYPLKRNWGHSTMEDGFLLSQKSGCKRLLFSHISFDYTDEEIDAMAINYLKYGKRFILATDGMEIEL